MNTCHAPDTELTHYLVRLRNELYKAIGVTRPEYIRLFEDEFYRILNNPWIGDKQPEIELAKVMAESTVNAIIFNNQDYEDLYKIVKKIKIKKV